MSQAVSNTLTPFRNIKDDYTPAPVPFSLFCNCCPLCLHPEYTLPFLCYACVTFSVFLNKCNEPFRHEATERRLRLIIKLRAFFVSGEILKELGGIWCGCGDKHDDT